MALKEKIAKLLNFKGPTAAVLTPYDNEGEVNTSMINGYVKYLTDTGCNGIFVTGTMGEGYSLTNSEKISIAKKWTDEINDQKKNLLMIMNVTSTCIKESQQLARECEKLSVDAIAVLPPIYYKPTSVDELINYLKRYADAAPNTPILYYFIPSFTGELPFDILEFVGTALKKIPQFAAMKYTDSNIIRMTQLQKFKDNIKIFAGLEETLTAAAFAAQINAAIGVSFSIPSMVESYQKILEAHENNDISTARNEQKKINDFMAIHKSSGNFFLSMKVAVNDEVKSKGLCFGFPRPPIHYP